MKKNLSLQLLLVAVSLWESGPCRLWLTGGVARMSRDFGADACRRSAFRSRISQKPQDWFLSSHHDDAHGALAGAGDSIMMTSFTRIVVVLSFIRQALGTQQMPPNQLIVGLALFLSFFVMAPTWKAISTNAIEPYLNEKIDQTDGLRARRSAAARVHVRSDARKGPRALSLAVERSQAQEPRRRADLRAGSVVRDQRAQDGVSDRLHALSAVSGSRHGGRERADGDGDDDVAAGR